MVLKFGAFSLSLIPSGSYFCCKSSQNWGDFWISPQAPLNGRGINYPPNPPQKTEPFLRKVSFFEVAWLYQSNSKYKFFCLKTFRLLNPILPERALPPYAAAWGGDWQGKRSAPCPGCRECGGPFRNGPPRFGYYNSGEADHTCNKSTSPKGYPRLAKPVIFYASLRYSPHNT